MIAFLEECAMLKVPLRSIWKGVPHLPRAWFLGLFSVVVWTVFLLIERALPKAPTALLLLLALTGGLAAAFLDQRFSLPKVQRGWLDHVLFCLVFGALGLICGAHFAPFFSDWFSGVFVEPQPTLASFISDGPALLIFLSIIVNTAHRRRAAAGERSSVLAARSALEGTVGLCAGAVAWSWLPAVLGPAAQPIHVYAYCAGVFAMTVLTWIVPYARKSAGYPPGGA